ncbi:hypothetical protein A3D78_00875 [Candidatus Gottesmanbacteria bacterium RIFCSPHIGHO2_02_FULL_39_14]|uniref:BioF2-like acetyltransferase domain-containing protein n=2 Tax=Candidatus Gottesmaniibacteriota TaxID=1752720 RepID=A0A1F6A0A6_9BACT|nr:MAG: hypothetical protein A3D78_00875 [Candidatus Gottesmanbacteria bacterium RIFCSPHIGHO2_02_FULL_39_14]OGG31035.1 MAG: hypothetical protein A3I51_00330 [Candidatus Gottesmanbacteria bacterium RIFCSPLOWO2_02_FULL_38_8]
MRIKIIDDKNQWEKFITSHSPQSFFQSWNWGETINRTRDKKVLFLNRYGLFNDNNVLIGIFQLVKVNARRGIFLHIRHGPILSQWDKPVLYFLKNYLIQLSKIEKASFVRLSPLVLPQNNLDRLFNKMGFVNSPIASLDGEYCWVLDLDKSEDDLLKSMRKTTRYLIRWALKNNIVINTSADRKDLDEFLDLYHLTAKRQHFAKHQGIKEEFEIFGSQHQALIFKGYYQKKLLSAAIIIFYQNQAIYHHSASRQQKIPVNYLLQWQAIRQAKKRQMKMYNFWGIAPPFRNRHPWNNLTLFKKGFGGRIIEYYHCRDLPVNKLSYLKTYTVEYLRKIMKGY